jgi:hypothetical protein
MWNAEQLFCIDRLGRKPPIFVITVGLACASLALGVGDSFAMSFVAKSLSEFSTLYTVPDGLV